MKLLTVGNTKTVKGEKLGYMTFIMHLAPSDVSGYNACPMASAGCRSACLNTAGRGRFDATQAARIRKTREFFENRVAFMAQLEKDIVAAEKKAAREGFVPVIRLNGTSDIRWENEGIMEKFPHIQFYDYTKIANRRNLPANYNLTFSRSESNDAVLPSVTDNIAVVFNVKKGAPLPATYIGRPVVDGDETDLRFLDPANVVVGLRGKGEAKKSSHGGFVVNV